MFNAYNMSRNSENFTLHFSHKQPRQWILSDIENRAFNVELGTIEDIFRTFNLEFDTTEQIFQKNLQKDFAWF